MYINSYHNNSIIVIEYELPFCEGLTAIGLGSKKRI